MRTLFLARHGEASGDLDDSGLTERGAAESRLLAERLRGRPIAQIHHSPMHRAEQTAEIIASILDVPAVSCRLVGDAIPNVPDEGELDPRCAAFVAGFSAEARTFGPMQMASALARFARPPDHDVDVDELIVTHNFVIGGFVVDALDIASWRWLTLNQDNCALTTLRYRHGREPILVGFNDVGHLLDRRPPIPAQ